jgi:hypothetical protein
MSKEQAEKHRAEAARHFQAEADSFQRSDTDGALSQWAHSVNGQLERLKAELAEADGKWTFSHLHTLDGLPVKAKVIKTRFGSAWALLDEAGNFTGTFISEGLRPATLAKKGFQMLDVELPAYAKLAGSGTGLAGALTVRAVIRPAVEFPEGAVVVR